MEKKDVLLQVVHTTHCKNTTKSNDYIKTRNILDLDVHQIYILDLDVHQRIII